MFYKPRGRSHCKSYYKSYYKSHEDNVHRNSHGSVHGASHNAQALVSGVGSQVSQASQARMCRSFTRSFIRIFQKRRLLGATLLVLGCTQSALAAESADAKPQLWTDQEIAAQRLLDERANPAVQIRRHYALGVNRYSLNHATRLIGWQVGESLYFGRAKGEESGIALVWQRRWNQQVSLSNDGIRLTRHF